MKRQPWLEHTDVYYDVVTVLDRWEEHVLTEMDITQKGCIDTGNYELKGNILQEYRSFTCYGIMCLSRLSHLLLFSAYVMAIMNMQDYTYDVNVLV